VPLVGTHAAEGEKVRGGGGGAPPALRLRFPVGARIELREGCVSGQQHSDEWLKGSVVCHWWRSEDRSWWVAGEWAAYQLKMDTVGTPLVYCATDHYDSIRAAAPASPQRLVRQLRR
jgi:hypothetical protein